MSVRKFVFLLFAATIIFVGVVLHVSGSESQTRENITFAFYPSAELAYEYGNVHFNASNVDQYDIKRAEYWYEEALKLDSTFPGVYHQLARVSFLRGNFNRAMVRINAEINLPNGPVSASSYYIRGLIEGYMGRYDDSVKDYERYLESDPRNWAALNDLAWVLLKGNQYAYAEQVTQKGLIYFPSNPWLLNSSATALFELGRYEEALAQVEKAHAAVSDLSQQQWLVAYPGNDPQVAGLGVMAFKNAVSDNRHTIQMKVDSDRL